MIIGDWAGLWIYDLLLVIYEWFSLWALRPLWRIESWIPDQVGNVYPSASAQSAGVQTADRADIVD